MSKTILDIVNSEIEGSGSDTRITNTPPEWRPRIELDTNGGYVVSTARKDGNMPDAVELLKEFKLDPNEWEITTVRTGKWQRWDGEWLESRRINLKPRGNGLTDDDTERLFDMIKKHKPAKRTPFSGDKAYVSAIGDSQYGKDAGGGTDATVKRVLGALDESIIRYRELQKLGRQMGTVVLPQLGDCIEGSNSQNGKILGRTDLGVTNQVRIGRRVLFKWVEAFAPLCDELIIPVVPGNHDETHRQLLTDPVDSWQVEIASIVQDMCALVPEYAHVQFRYPAPDHSTLSVEVKGVMLGFAHGHQSRDIPKWWHGQATGRTPVGDADILLTGHYHHFRADQVGPRLWVQTPAMDGGSAWFRDSKGLESPTGVVSMVIGDGYDPRRDLAVLGGEQRPQ